VAGINALIDPLFFLVGLLRTCWWGLERPAWACVDLEVARVTVGERNLE
jgi:hypothetical protein